MTEALKVWLKPSRGCRVLNMKEAEHITQGLAGQAGLYPQSNGEAAEKS